MSTVHTGRDVIEIVVVVLLVVVEDGNDDDIARGFVPEGAASGTNVSLTCASTISLMTRLMIAGPTDSSVSMEAVPTIPTSETYGHWTLTARKPYERVGHVHSRSGNLAVQYCIIDGVSISMARSSFNVNCIKC